MTTLAIIVWTIAAIIGIGAAAAFHFLVMRKMTVGTHNPGDDIVTKIEAAAVIWSFTACAAIMITSVLLMLGEAWIQMLEGFAL